MQCLLASKLYPDFLSRFFILTSFNTTPMILLVKLIIIRIVRKYKVTKSGGLIWADFNAMDQNKFPSTIHLLRQHLLVESHRWKHQTNV